MSIETAILLLVVAFVLGIGVGHWLADWRKAKMDASRIMRTRSNYRRGRYNQK